MNAIFHSNTKPSFARPANWGARLVLPFSAGACLLMTFLVPIEWLNVFACPFLTLTGLPCPFCGFTRSLLAISAGDWLYATINCPLAWLIYTIMVLVFAGGIGILIPGIKKTTPFLLSLFCNHANLAVRIIISLVLLNWVYRLTLGLT